MRNYLSFKALDAHKKRNMPIVRYMKIIFYLGKTALYFNSINYKNIARTSSKIAIDSQLQDKLSL